MTRITLFSHGFGVLRDDRGLFTDIAAALPGRHVLFDYNDPRPDGTLFQNPFSVQAKRLTQQLAAIRNEHPDAVVDVVAHSQGCYAVALANPTGIRNVILVAPLVSPDLSRTIDRYRDKAGAVIDMEGESRLPRTDGSITIVPAQYWRERATGPAPITLYNTLAEHTRTTIIHANQDQVLKAASYEGLDPRVPITRLDSDHDFTGAARQVLVQEVRRLLA